MSKKIVSLFLALLMAVSMTTAMAESITVTDMFDREVTLTGPITRIVALEPSDCEILCALGCEEALVGRGKYCDYPASVLELPAVASGANTNLEEILFLTHGVPEIAASAFSGLGDGELYVFGNGLEACSALAVSNWSERMVEIIDLSEMQTYLSYCMNGCYCTNCTWSYRYKKYDEDYHMEYAACNNCSANEYAYGTKRAHTFSGNTCTVCGYTRSSGGSSGGGGSTTTCYHSRTYKTWSGCDWYEYCYYCDEFLDYGTTHGTYTYGSWSYYSTSQHRRTYACSDCGEGSYEYKSHSTTT